MQGMIDSTEAESFKTPMRPNGRRMRLDRQAPEPVLLVMESHWIIDLGSGLIMYSCLSIYFGDKMVAVGVQDYTA